MRSPARNCGSAAGSAQIDQPPPRRGAIKIEQIEQRVIDRGEPERRVRQDRKKRHQKGADQHGARRLQDKPAAAARWRRSASPASMIAKGSQCALQPFRLRHRQCQQHAANRRQRQRLKRDRRGDEQRRKQQFAILDQLLQDNARRRQHIGRVFPAAERPPPTAPRKAAKATSGGAAAIKISRQFGSRRAHGSSSPMARRSAFEARRESLRKRRAEAIFRVARHAGIDLISSMISPPLRRQHDDPRRKINALERPNG